MDTVAPEPNRKNKTPEVTKAHRKGEVSARNTQDEENGKKKKNILSEIAAHMSAFLENMPKFNFRHQFEGNPWIDGHSPVKSGIGSEFVHFYAAQRKMTPAPKIAARRQEGVEKAERHPSSQNSEVNSKGKQRVSGGILCVLCQCSVAPRIDQNIYLFDLSSEEELFDDDDVDDDGFVPRPPNLRFSFPGLETYALCALGSTLFMIEPALDWVNPENKFIYSFDLSSANPWRFSNSVLCKSSLFPRGQMLYAKRLPCATPTPDGKKILIFSRLLNYNHLCRGPPRPDHDVADEIEFELFDPLTDFFERLPQIPHNCQDSSIVVEMWRFINNSTFLVQTRKIGTFTLDLDDLKSGWKKSGGFFSKDVGLNCVIKDGFVFSPVHACEEDDASVNFPIPVFPFNGDDSESVESDAFDNFRPSSSCVALLENNGGGDVELCVVQAGVDATSESPLMVVDVLSIDVNTYWEEKKKGKKNVKITARNVRSFNLKLCLGDEPCGRISTLIVFSFPAQRKKMAHAPIIVASQNSEVNRKGKQRPSVTVSGGILCVLCQCSVGLHIEQNIYLFDLSSEEELFDDDDDGFVRRPPNLRFIFPGLETYALCALGSTLFMIEPALDWVNPKNKFIYSFDLSSVNPWRFSNSVMSKSSLFPRRQMLYAKRLPRAIPTPDGKKILIFSTLLNYNHPCRGPPRPDHDVADEIDFELFDPLTDFFERLPQIPHNCQDSSIVVEIWRFINNSTFLVQTSKIGTFTLDLDDLKSGWKKSGGFFSKDVGLNCVIKDGFIFSPYRACEEDNTSVIYPFPLFPFYGDYSESVETSDPFDNFRPSSSCVALLENNGGGDVDLCVVQAGVNAKSESPLMVVDVLGIDINTYWEEKKKGNKNVEITARNVRSFKLCLGDEPCSKISTRLAFSFPGGT